MVPIHDTDLAEERWSQSEWDNYELWEKIEYRLKRRKKLWVFATFILFIALSAVPIVLDRWPKWKTRAFARKLAQEINHIKNDAITQRAAFRLRFAGEGKLSYAVEKLESCSSQHGEIVRSGTLSSSAALTTDVVPESKESNRGYTWLSESAGTELQVPGLVQEFCYDYLLGSSATQQDGVIIGFGIISVKDLTEKRLDRLSLLILSGTSAEISFD